MKIVSRNSLHHNKDTEKREITCRLCIVYYTNTLLMPLIIAWIVEKSDLFSTNWYHTVGTLICIPVFLESAMAFLFTICTFSFLKKHCQRKADTCCIKVKNKDYHVTRSILQSDYESLYIGIDFLIEDRYGRLVSMVLIILSYSSTIPFLYGCGAILCFSMYWGDKYMLLRFYKNQ